MTKVCVLQVPLFQNLDDLILDNICDRVKPLVFSKDEKVQNTRHLLYHDFVLVF